MPTISRRGAKWRAQIRRLGHSPISKSGFRTKGEAWAWAHQREREVIAGLAGEPTKHTLKEALDKYALEVSSGHKGAKWEKVRLAKLGRLPWAQKRMAAVTTTDLSKWRDEALGSLKPASVRREMGLLGQVFDIARREWKWIVADPTKDVTKPAPARARPKEVPHEAIWGMVAALGETRGGRETALAFLIACECAMRPSELFSLTPDQVNFGTDVAHLERTKNGDERDVPLSMLAHMWLLELLWMNRGRAFFSIASDTASALWFKARKDTPFRAHHFRHSRREGIRRLSKRLDILELARAVGHRDLKSLMIYYQTSAADMATKLQ